MNKSLVKSAWLAFNNKDYEKSHDLYLQAANLIGYDFFSYNIDLCRKKIAEKTTGSKVKKDIVLTVLDPISELCWKNQYHGYQISRNKFVDQISGSRANFAFFESAWKANKGSWEYAFTSPGLKHANAQALTSAIDLLKSKEIPILFWNKEDPMHFDMFLPIAKKVDYVFTTDELSVPNYKKQLGHSNVFSLPFAAPIEITNPLNRFAKTSETVCFAGTYYAQNHEDRKKQMDAILGSIIQFDGVIYDRASAIAGDKYSYPQKYHRHIRPAIQFDEMVKVYKNFEVFLNVNTIVNSPTMMSRRVYELLASGTPVVSTPSKSITEQFPGIVLTVTNEHECNVAVNKLLTDKFFWCQKSLLGIREVMRKHTYTQRWKKIEKCIGRDVEEDNDVTISVVIKHKNDFLLEKQLDILSSLKYSFKEIFVCSDDLKKSQCIVDRSLKIVNNVDIYYKNNIESIDVKSMQGDYVFFLSEFVLYGANYFEDQLIPFLFSDSISAAVKCNVLEMQEVEDGFLARIEKNYYARWHSLCAEANIFHSAIKKSKFESLSVDLKSGIIKSGSDDSVYITDFFNAIRFDEIHEFKNYNNLIYKNFLKVCI